MAIVEKRQLTPYRGVIVESDMRAAHDQLMRDVLGHAKGPQEPPSDLWTSFAYFESGGRCVANVEAAILPLVLGGVETTASGLRSVAVAPDWRGNGLFRDLMVEALAWCDTRSAIPTLLFTEDASLYRRFGFTPMPQHAHVGAAPVPRPGTPGRRLDPGRAADRRLIRALFERRQPLSSHCALGVDVALFLDNIAKDEALTMTHSPVLDALIVTEADEDEIVIADIVAAAVPDLATVLGILCVHRQRVKVLFPPDRLDWAGQALEEDTGLMVRGTIPAAMERPFMLPPTVEF